MPGEVKRKLHTYTPEQLEFIQAHSKIKRKELHEKFEAHFGIKVPYNGIVSLCTRQGWSNGNTGRFEKGHQLNKKYEIGEEYLDAYGYMVIKTSLTGRDRHQQKHRWLWEQANGRVPEDHYVSFKDGDKTNITLDNLILLNKRELACLNMHYQRLSDEDTHLTYIALSKLRCQAYALKQGK